MSRRIDVCRALGALALVSLAACGEGDAARDAQRAALEEEFGRRPNESESVRSGAETPDLETPGAASGGPTDPGDDPHGDPPSTGGSSRDTPPGEAAQPPGDRDSVDPDPADAPGADPEGEAAEPSGDAPQAVAAGVDVDSLLAAAERAYGRVTSLRAAFTQRMEVPLLERVSEGRGTWYQRGSGHFRMDFAEPDGDMLVADGTFFWAYQPSQQPNQVIRSRLGTGAEAGTVDVLGQILSEARTSYTSEHAGKETVSGQRTIGVVLTPIGSSRYRRVTVWVAESDGLVRRFRIEEENESIRTVTLSSLEPQVSLEDALFQFTVPPGVQVFEG